MNREVVLLPPVAPPETPAGVVEALQRRRDGVSKAAAKLILELCSKAGVDLQAKLP